MRDRVLLGVILVGAATLRFTALDYGRGIIARPDEPGMFMTLNMLGIDGGISPLLGLYGATFFVPLLAIVRTAAAWQGVAFPFEWTQAFPAVVVARAWSATLSTLTVWLAYRVGLYVRRPSIGLVAALLLAFCPLAVREAHSAKPDSAAAMMMTLWLLVVVRLWASRRSGSPLGLGAFAAAVLDTKLLLGVGPALLYAVLPSWRRVVVAAGACAAVTLALRWYMFVHPHEWLVLSPVFLQTSDATRFPGGDTVESALSYHLHRSFPYGCGFAIMLLIPPALIAAMRGSASARLLAIAVIAHLIPVFASRVVLARFLVPALPALFVLIALLLDDGIGALPVRVRSWAWSCAIVLLMAQPVLASVTIVRLLGRPDTRIEAGQWIARNIPAGSVVLTWGARGFADFGSPPLAGFKVRRVTTAESLGGGDWIVAQSYPLPYSDVPLPPLPPSFARVAVFSPYDGPTDSPVLEPLDAYYLPLGRFAGIERPGPEISVYHHEPVAPRR